MARRNRADRKTYYIEEKKDTKTERSRLEVKETCTKNSSGNADTIYGIQFEGNLCLVIRIAPGALH